MFFFEDEGDGVHTGVSLSNLLLDGMKGGHLIGDMLL
jgi:hypothetical protein